MNNNIIHKQRFILAKTEADFKREDAEGLICACDIAFIIEPGNKDIYTHGVYMLKEIKNSISQLKSTVDNHESRIVSNETDILNLKISLGNLESRITTNEYNIQNLSTRVTNVELAINNAKSDITNLNNEFNTFKNQTNNKFSEITNNITALTTTVVTILVVSTLPNISDANNHTIYLVPSVNQGTNNIYTEYILLNGKWEVIGTQKADLGLENYVTVNKLSQDLANYYTKSQTDGLLNGKANSSHSHTISDITNFPTFKTINGQPITGSGNISISTSDLDITNYWSLSGNTLSPTNSSYEVSAKTFYASSDERLKKNIKEISNEDVARLNNINLHEYSFNNEDIKRYGVIALELQNSGLTNLVTESEGKLAVDYTSLIILYIQKLEKEIETLKQKMNDYELKISNKE